MRTSALISLVALASSSVALPRGRRADSAKASDADITVFRFAEALQHLEDEYYKAAAAKFQDKDFTDAGFSGSELVLQQIQTIAKDEETHASALGDVLKSLGSSTIQGCKFNFDPVLGDVATVISTARVVENVGVGAFLGAAKLLTDPVLLTAAATTLTIEARHQTVLNIFAGTGHTIPNAFDLALLPNEVLAIAGPFVSGCDLGVGAALPSLSVNNAPAIVQSGAKLDLASDGIKDLDPKTLSCQFLAAGMPFSMTTDFQNCVIPDGINGPVAVFVTNDTNPLAGNPVDRFQRDIRAGPTMLFVDPSAQALPALVRNVDGVKLAKDDTSSSSGSSDSSSSSSDSSKGDSVSSGNSGDSVNSGNGGESSSSGTSNAGSNPGSDSAAEANGPAADASKIPITVSPTKFFMIKPEDDKVTPAAPASAAASGSSSAASSSVTGSASSSASGSTSSSSSATDSAASSSATDSASGSSSASGAASTTSA